MAPLCSPRSPRAGRQASPARPPNSVPRRHALALLIAGAAVAVGGVAAAGELASAPARLQLPATPRAWLDAYEAAAIDNPSRVCSELFAPQLAVA